MRLFQSAARTLVRKLYAIAGGGGWWPVVRESYTGAWQRNVKVDAATVSANWAVFACVTLIANDIAKMPARVMAFDAVKLIWVPTSGRPVLRKPNTFQTWPDFVRSWVFSLLLRGNTYVLKVRNDQQFIVAMYVLDPSRVTPMVSPAGDIFYDLHQDNLAGLETNSLIVPASEIIHDRINTLWHPLCGVSPIYASGIAAMQSLAIQENSAKFFQNMSQPGGVMTAPGAISDETATRLKESFTERFSGENLGKLLVLGDGLKYEAMTINAKDSQLIEQLKFSGEMICATFHVPPYKLGLGAMPTVNNTAALNQQYYDQCLHPTVDSMERRLDEGLEIDDPFLLESKGSQEVWFDTSELLRMDPSTRADANAKKINAGMLAPNEGRRDDNLPPVEGGGTPYLQQQNFSLAALARRDAQPDPFASPSAPQPADVALSAVDAVFRGAAPLVIH
ncbi:MAG: phage portal protein [Gammaproteobacteria bacterium]